MKSDILNNECIDRSPCLSCERKHLDKNECIDTCARLAAYRAGQPWEGKETVKIVEETEAKDQKPICEMPDCSEPAVARGLCREDYDRWRNGEIEHPRLGVFSKKNISVEKGICVFDECDEKAKIRGCCSPHYQAWRKGYIEHPVFGPYTCSQAKSHFKKLKPDPEAIEQKTPDQKIAKRSYPFPDLVTLDFTNYPEIKNVIFERVDKFLLPPEHLILSMLAGAIAGKKED